MATRTKTQETDNTPEPTQTATNQDIQPKPALTAESLRKAHEAQKAQFRPVPNKGDIAGELLENGEFGQTGTVVAKPDAGAPFVQIRMDRTGRVAMVKTDTLTDLGENAWTFTF